MGWGLLIVVAFEGDKISNPPPQRISKSDCVVQSVKLHVTVVSPEALKGWFEYQDLAAVPQCLFSGRILALSCQPGLAIAVGEVGVSPLRAAWLHLRR